MTTSLPAAAGAAPSPESLILAVLLFPIYWMVNVSLQPSGSAVGTPWLPLDLSFDGYATALSDQGRNLVTSLIVALGTVVFSLLIATPAAYALAQFRVRFAGVVPLRDPDHAR